MRTIAILGMVAMVAGCGGDQDPDDGPTIEEACTNLAHCLLAEWPEYGTPTWISTPGDRIDYDTCLAWSELYRDPPDGCLEHLAHGDCAELVGHGWTVGCLWPCSEYRETKCEGADVYSECRAVDIDGTLSLWWITMYCEQYCPAGSDTLCDPDASSCVCL